MERIRTGRGPIRDIEKNVVELCREAFDEEDFLKYESDYRPAASDFRDVDPINGKVQELPALYVWCDSEVDEGNETGGLGGRRQRNKSDYTVIVLYVTHSDLPQEGQQMVRAIGDKLKRKLVANSDLFKIANMGGRLKNLNFDPEMLLMSDGTLTACSAARIIMEYTIVERQRRAR